MCDGAAVVWAISEPGMRGTGQRITRDGQLEDTDVHTSSKEITRDYFKGSASIPLLIPKLLQRNIYAKACAGSKRNTIHIQRHAQKQRLTSIG